MLQSGISYCIPPERERGRERNRQTEREDVWRKVRKDYEISGGEEEEQVEEKLIMLLHTSLLRS